MADPKTTQKSDQTTANQPNMWSFYIIIGTLVAVLIVIIVTIVVFKQSTDVTSVLGVILPSVSTIAAAAFGLTVGTQAGSQAGQATANATKDQTARVQQEAKKHLLALQRATTSVSGEIRKLPQDNGIFTLDMANLQNFTGRTGNVTVHPDTLADIHTQIASIESVLDTLPT